MDGGLVSATVIEMCSVGLMLEGFHYIFRREGRRRRRRGSVVGCHFGSCQQRDRRPFGGVNAGRIGWVSKEEQLYKEREKYNFLARFTKLDDTLSSCRLETWKLLQS